MGINKIVYGGVTKLDISNDTVTPSSLLEGYTAHDNTGAAIVGTAKGGAEQGNVWQDVEGYLHLDDESGISLQTKNATPSETAQTIKPDAGYYALDKVNVGAISSTYVGSGIATRSSSDLTVSGSTVTAPSGYYANSASKSVASGTAGTPTATKGTVSNHSVSVTPSVTNTTGFIAGSTKTGTAVTVSASELVSGTKSITENGTSIDVTNYASVDVNVSGGYTVSLNYDKYYNESYAYVEHNGVRYSQQTEFTIGMDDEITLYATYIVYVDGHIVASQNQGTTTYTFAPKDNISIRISGNSSNYVILRAGRETKGLVKILFDTTCIDSPVNTFYIPDYITSIGDYAFYHNFPLNNISLSFHDGITKIGEYAFYECRALSVTSLPNTISSIGAYAFYECANLALTSLPSNLTEIKQDCFYGCTNLALTSLPSGITKIGQAAFVGCSNLSITELPQNISTIGSSAFTTCTNIELTSLPDNLTKIESYTFRNCIKITSLQCNAPLTDIGENAFTGQSGYPMTLEEAYFPNSVMAQLTYAFGSTTAANACQALRILDIGSVTKINANALANCNALTTLILRKSNAITTLANVSAFLNTPMRGYNSLTGTVYVPSALISSYQTATNWSTLYNNGTVNFVAIEGSEYEL